MARNNTVYVAVIEKAAKEAGIRDGEKYDVTIRAIENNICEFELETEWNRITCYADLRTHEILGILAEPKTIYEMLWRPSLITAAGTVLPGNTGNAV